MSVAGQPDFHKLLVYFYLIAIFIPEAVLFHKGQHQKINQGQKCWDKCPKKQQIKKPLDWSVQIKLVEAEAPEKQRQH
jgi:hypothetical protein